jgi:hypothetical protein
LIVFVIVSSSRVGAHSDEEDPHAHDERDQQM